ncbi:MAG TPA: putative porin [Bacteroidales bacterium]
MKFLLKFLLLTVLTLTSIVVIAQEPETPSGDNQQSKEETTSAENQQRSPDTATVFSFNPINDFTGFHKYSRFSASLSNVQDYDPARKNGMDYANLGNLGLASQSIIYGEKTGVGFNYGGDAFNLYRLSPENTPFFSSKKPFTHLYYVMGKGKEQFFDVKHSQQINKQLTIGANFRWFRSPGLYLRQGSNHSNMAVYSFYHTPNNRYLVLASYFYNNLKAIENGGILHDSVFTQNIEFNRQLLEVNLSDASNRLKNNEVLFSQTFFLRKPHPAQVKKNDTTQQISPKRPLLFYFQPGCITHTFSWKSEGMAYSDSKPAAYYPVIYYNGVGTYDSVFNTSMENRLMWSNARPDSASRHDPLIIQGGVWQRMAYVWQDSASNNFNQAGTEAKAIINIIPRVELKGWIRYITSGYHRHDFTTRLQGNLLFSKGVHPGILSFTYRTSQLEPDYFFEHYAGNRFRWERSYAKQLFNSITVSAVYRGFDAGISMYTGTNVVYMDQNAFPKQATGTYTVSQVWLLKDLQIGHLSFDNKFFYQHVAGSDIIRVPELTANSTVSFNLTLFKNALQTEFGISLFYHTKWKGDAWMSATRTFYLQDTITTGGYVYADAFLNFKIKRARLFLKYQHVNSGWMDYNYFMAPHYPQPDRGLKFGVSWLFYD